MENIATISINNRPSFSKCALSHYNRSEYKQKCTTYSFLKI
jgi:hypothetical protein